MKPIGNLATVLALLLGVSAAAAQPAKMLREQLVGTWSFVIAEITAADGKKSLPFGDKPKGMIIFTADGHFSQVHVAGGLPRIASNNRLAGITSIPA
jgi:Lipocalin-like domain